MSPAELEQRAERAVRRGELLVALEHFDAYLAQQPDDERRALARPTAKADLGHAERLEAPETTLGKGVSKMPRSAKAVGASFAPISSPPAKNAARPKDRVKLLESLLERIRSSRRKA